MKQVDVNVTSRSRATKNANRRSRRSGRLPAIIYGGETAPLPISLDSFQFGRILQKALRTTIYNLKVDDADAAQQVIIREIQRDPVVDDDLIHVDFLRIQIDKAIVVEVPVHGLGTPEGIRQGGVLETINRRVSIKCLPLEVPDALEIDISALEIGSSVHVSDLTIPAGVEVLTSADSALFIVAAPKLEEEEEEEKDEEAIEGEEGAEGAEATEGAEGEEKKAETDKEKK